MMLPATPRSLLLVAVLGLGVAAAIAQGDMPAEPFGSSSNGGWFDKERKIAPAAGKQPHIAMILMDGAFPASQSPRHRPLVCLPRRCQWRD
jgi:hypothetical protein